MREQGSRGAGGDEGDEGDGEVGEDGEAEEVFSPPCPLVPLSPSMRTVTRLQYSAEPQNIKAKGEKYATPAHNATGR
ncbi:MAG: hypothetical protein HC862_10645 [Scytonema sp. RU_4_4]|nr:hypothetical protein [Scytonema sp. RU_4_4]